MDMRRAWYTKIEKTTLEVRLLITIGLGRRSELKIKGHPGTWGKVIRASTHQDVHVQSENGYTYPYWPTVVNWPNISYNYEPHARRVSEVSTQVDLLSLSTFVEQFFKKDYPQNSWIQMDLWIPGLTLEESLTIFAGPIDNVSFESEKGIVSLGARDTFDGIRLEFPFTGDYLDKNEFRDVNDFLAGRAPRRFVLNDLRDFIPCTSISTDNKTYYVCEPALDRMPTEVWVGTNRLKEGQFRFKRSATDVSGQPFTKLVLNERVENLGQYGQVYARGGSGPRTNNPIRFFIDRQPGLEITERAGAYLGDIDRRGVYDYYVLIENKGEVLQILQDRLLPQSDLVGFFRGGRFDLIRQNEVTRIHSLSLNSQLKYRLPINEAQTPDDNIANAIDIQYRRNHQNTGGRFSRFARLIDKGYGGLLGRHLEKSEALYGRRFLRVDATDLGSILDAERLGISMAKTLAFPHRKFRYHMDYHYGLYMDLNDRIRLTDPEIMASNLNCRVVGMEFLPTGINVTLQTEDGVMAF